MHEQATYLQHFLKSHLIQLRVLVIGDLMLDRYLWGEVGRISPEAPVPIVKLVRESENVGGAGNVAMNLKGLGLDTEIAGWVGQDNQRQTVLDLFATAGIETSGIHVWPTKPTITKTRVIGGHQQMLRLDAEVVEPLPSDLETQWLQTLLSKINAGLNAIILSDYAKGALSEHTCQTVIQAARQQGIPVLVDPKGHSFAKYRGATTITPNLSEMSLACQTPAKDIESLILHAQAMCRDLNFDFVTLTRSEDGISLVETNAVHHFPTVAKEVFDVSGAGDTVIATLAAGLAAGLQPSEAIQLANVAAGVVVSKMGTVPVKLQELQAAQRLGSQRRGGLLDVGEVAEQVKQWQQRGEKVVFTNGCFDILHAGHVSYLNAARQEGDRLIVGLNSDASVRRLKGETRPVNTLEDRALVLAGLGAVDAVVAFEDDTPLQLIETLLPDVLVKGGDYTVDTVVGAAQVQARGGRVALMPTLEGRSTTGIIRKIGNPERA